jgi:membrane protease YdiL (CAAX protease family)
VGLAHAPILDVDSQATLGFHVVVLGVAAFTRQAAVLHPALVTTLMAAVPAIQPVRASIGALPVVPLLAPLALSTAVVYAVPWARLPQWVSRGSVDAISRVLTLAIALLSAAALIAWAAWTDSFGIGARMMQEAARWPVAVLVFIGIPLFALFNAATEEAVYRGVLQRALALSGGRVWPSIGLQALAFAALHYEAGFPNGGTGYVMVFLYGVALGYLRHRTGGLAAPILTHVLADLVIGYTLLAAVGA